MNVASTNRNANVNGLPGSAVNITLDGVNIQDNTLKSSDGFFTIVQPRTDAIEEVSITGAAAGANDGQGAITVKFVTKSGTNSYKGSLYEIYRNDKFNANTWFSLRDGVAKAPLHLYDNGASAGGPIAIPGLFSGKNKAFFFFNVEYVHQPASVTRTRTILQSSAQSGVFSYVTASGVQRVNLLTLAAADAVLVASGTATLEAALFKRPMVVAYKMHPLTWQMMKRMAYQPWVSLPNILARDFLVPELIQEACTPQALATQALAWLDDPARRAQVHQTFCHLHRELRRDTARCAADAIAQELES